MKSAIPRFARGPERAPPRATDLFTASRTPRSTSVTLSSRAICMWGGAQRDESQGHGRRYEGEAVDAEDTERVIRVRDVPCRRPRSPAIVCRGAGRPDVARPRG